MYSRYDEYTSCSNFPLQLFDENKIPRRNLVFLIQKKKKK
ncbi:hypothetical protein [Escherichia coli ISC7]|uniref:Uncharacterized protein n=1 Tax=Escherichia coli ISC7 TaxID=1432555 RepID=W1FA08_ECOLX|nr:hypothetical protein [Escherichia coli ISC7]